MKILLDAYFDNNFGDDLFVSIILERYPNAQFYVFWNKQMPGVLARAMEFPNLTILPGTCQMQERMPFDAYIMVGGDVLPDGMDYSGRIAGMRRVKEQGGFVAMLGFSLYKEYGEKTRGDLAQMANLADSIVTRDQASARLFRELVPGAEVLEATDMVFAARSGAGIVSAAGSIEDKRQPILGMAPRRRLYSSDEEHEAYCKGMAAVADEWLAERSDGKVRLLAFSTGEYDDRETCQKIMDLMREDTEHSEKRAETEAYTGDVKAFQQSLAACTAFVPTRFHALVFALILEIPFVPVPYEVKLTQVLDEIGYEGIRLPYGECLAEEDIRAAVDILTLQKNNVMPEQQKLLDYLKKADAFFAAADDWMKRRDKKPRKVTAEEMACFECRAAKDTRIMEENEALRKQVEDLKSWVTSLQAERQAFEQQNLELETIRVQQQELLAKIRSEYGMLGNLWCKVRRRIRGRH